MTEQETKDREILKARAETLGIKLQGNQSNDTIRTLIKNHMEKMNNEAGDEEEDENEVEDTRSVTEKIIEENMRLVRCTIYNNDPKKAKMTGEIITVANEYLGTVRKLVLFGEKTDNGYHIPYCIYKQLLARKYLQITERTDNNGNPYAHTREVKEYTVEVLPPLTEAELKQLADKQLAAGYDAAE